MNIDEVNDFFNKKALKIKFQFSTEPLYSAMKEDNLERYKAIPLVNRSKILNLKVIFKFARPVDTFFESDFEEFGKLKEKSIVKGHFYDHMEFVAMPENEDEFKTLLEKVLDNYSNYN